MFLTIATPWTVAHQAPLSMGFSRQKYWSGLPFPLPGDLPDPRMEPESSADGFFTTEPLGKPMMRRIHPKNNISTKFQFLCINSQGKVPFLWCVGDLMPLDTCLSGWVSLPDLVSNL